jgi:3-methyladenine DNA glycosylase AlkD
VIQFKKDPQAIYNAYVQHIEYVNNWDLVDTSAYQIAGAYLYTHRSDKEILYKWVESKNLWIRRIAIVSSLAFIKKGEIEETFLISEKLLHDKEDLIHKAMGWMLREASKKNEQTLEIFLRRHLKLLPRTTLRYAIERFEKSKRENLLRA